ncbi:Hypp5162 [Branchiostoma lanceolatum]|uniref:Hypp5162 protein n=1 Tax=Branchiostoma lanceolatum TaxID=7740 RepID=A0A8K0EYF2_BRALA|nr:Hypp5162 [Branchiostoma lanceolatum]
MALARSIVRAVGNLKNQYFNVHRHQLLKEEAGKIAAIYNADVEKPQVLLFDSFKSALRLDIPRYSSLNTVFFTRVGQEDCFAACRQKKKKKSIGSVSEDVGHDVSFCTSGKFLSTKLKDGSPVCEIQVPDLYYDSGADDPSIHTDLIQDHLNDFLLTTTTINGEEEPCVLTQMEIDNYIPDEVYEVDLDDDWSAVGNSMARHYDQFISVRKNMFLFSREELVPCESHLVTFRVHCSGLHPHEEPIVTGDLIPLGKRDPAQGLRMEHQQAEVWLGTCYLPKNMNFTWRMAVMNTESNTIVHEEEFGRSGNAANDFFSVGYNDKGWKGV